MQFLKQIYHFFLAQLGAIIYRHPSRELFVIGITGTKGKTTTAELLYTLLQAEGKKTAIISSTAIRYGDEVKKNMTETTMPGRFFIQRFLRHAVRSGCAYAIVEVTSQGVTHYRHRGIDFDAGLFLNLHPEHIEAHGTFEKYRDAKYTFFLDIGKHSVKKEKHFFINEHDFNRDHFVRAGRDYGAIIYFNRETFLKRELDGKKNMLGQWFMSDFNLENAAAATSVAQTLGIDWEVIKKTLTQFSGLSGRMEIIQEKPFRFVIDYAHTPDSLEGLYSFLQPRNKTGSMICILGSAGGGRDIWKRPKLGEIAARHCDAIILTDEDSYNEKPEKIFADIRAGISGKNVHEIIDRREAMRKGISLAREGDTVVISGKGSEMWIHGPRRKKIPWSEKAVAEEFL